MRRSDSLGRMPVRAIAVLLALAALTLAVFASSAQAKPRGPNGQIVFAREDPALGDTVIFTANPDGSHRRRLLPGFTAESPHWSPDGTHIAVASSLGLPCCDFFPYSAVIVNPDTGAYKALPMLSQHVITFCTIWSPNGKRLACNGGNDNDLSVDGIYTIRSSDGGGLRRITDANGGSDVPIDYSPDGSKLVYGHMGPFNTCDTHSALWVVNVDGTNAHQVTPDGFCDDDGSWSPDGTRIAFEHRGSLFKVHPNGTGLAKIPLATSSFNREGDVSWSPNGKKISFLLFAETSPGTGQEGIATANADGTNVRWATNSPTFDHEDDWGTHPLAH